MTIKYVLMCDLNIIFVEINFAKITTCTKKIDHQLKTFVSAYRLHPVIKCQHNLVNQTYNISISLFSNSLHDIFYALLDLPAPRRGDELYFAEQEINSKRS